MSGERSVSSLSIDDEDDDDLYVDMPALMTPPRFPRQDLPQDLSPGLVSPGRTNEDEVSPVRTGSRYICR